jgi:hypothetical protein
MPISDGGIGGIAGQEQRHLPHFPGFGMEVGSAKILLVAHAVFSYRLDDGPEHSDTA